MKSGSAKRRCYPALGEAGNPTFGAARSAPVLGMDLRSARPTEGKGAALILPRCNSQAMSLHLAEIAAAIAPGAHAVVMLDQAGWHLAGALEVLANMTLLPIPPRCPELNPVENVWLFMRDNWLWNRV